MDKTPAQRDYMRQLIQYVDKHNAEHPDSKLRKKYVSGIPKAVTASSVNDSANTFQEPPENTSD